MADMIKVVEEERAAKEKNQEQRAESKRVEMFIITHTKTILCSKHAFTVYENRFSSNTSKNRKE